jgi:hypothetical protein
MKKIICCFVGMLVLGACAGVPKTASDVSKQARVTVSGTEKLIEFSNVDVSHKVGAGRQIKQMTAKTTLPAYVQNFWVTAKIVGEKAKITLVYFLVDDDPIALKNVTDNFGNAFSNDPLGQEVTRPVWKLMYVTKFGFDISQKQFSAYKNGVTFKVNLSDAGKAVKFDSDEISFEVPGFYVEGVLDRIGKEQKPL